MTNYITPAQAAATIRAALKAKGWTSRQISVRADQFAGGSAVDVVVKDLAVPLAAVREIVKEQERIRYDEMSGEILAGGNRYVSVHYDQDAIEEAAAGLLPEIVGLAPGEARVVLQVQVRLLRRDAFELIDLVACRSVGQCSFTAQGAAEAIVEIAACRRGS